MISSIKDNSDHYKTWFLLFGLACIIFCFFLDVAESEFKSNDTTLYLTFSGKQHSSSSDNDCFFKLKSCSGSICNIVKATPIMAGFALGFGLLTLILQSGIDMMSRYLKKLHNRILQLVCLFVCFVMMLVIPILYLATKFEYYTLCWFAIFLEFLSTFMIAIAALLYFKANNTGWL